MTETKTAGAGTARGHHGRARPAPGPVGRDRGPGDRGRDVRPHAGHQRRVPVAFMLDNMFRPPVIEGVRTSLTADRAVDDHRGDARDRDRHDAAVPEPDPVRGGLALHLVLPRRAPDRAADPVRQPGHPVRPLRVRAAVRPPARQPVRDRPRRPPVRPRRPDHPDRLHGRPAGAGPVRGGLHGRDRAGGHEGGRPGPAGGGPRPRHGAAGRPCAGSSCPRRCG